MLVAPVAPADYPASGTMEDWYQHLVIALLTIKEQPELLNDEEEGVPLAEYFAVDKKEKTYVSITIHKSRS